MPRTDCIHALFRPLWPLSVVDEDFLARSSDNEMLLVVLGRDLASIDELKNFLTDFGRLVFLNDMATVGDHVHLVLSLHVRHCELRVHSFCTGQEEHLLRRQGQEALS